MLSNTKHRFLLATNIILVWWITSHKMDVAADDCKYDRCEYESGFWFTHSLPPRNSSQFCLIASYHNLALNQPFSLNYQSLFGVGEYEYVLHSYCIVYDSQLTTFLLTPSRSTLIWPLAFIQMQNCPFYCKIIYYYIKHFLGLDK